uniref:RRM domain-containing protein n=1 Tax=Strongyloides papillosus TaxID=174720 RepID=A0A0N5CD67_STREA
MIVRMRGLPFNCTKDDVVKFFTNDNLSSGIIENGIIFIYKSDGKLSGDAFVIFDSEINFKRALLNHKKSIGQRYIELFKSNLFELNKYLLDVKFNNQFPFLKKDCIRLRGLPFEANIPQIINFLGESVNLVKQHGIHMILNNKGEPSGEAFIQLISENAAFQATSRLNKKFMVVGKKKRYIEVFQVSFNDVNLIAVPQFLNTIYQPIFLMM